MFKTRLFFFNIFKFSDPHHLRVGFECKCELYSSVYHRHCLSVFVISHHNDRFVVLSVLKQRPSPASSVPSPKTYTTSFGGVFSSVSRCYLDD
ncbi:hypothetical protein ACOSQ2_032135 [Xanthoceras sorbifolium]